jgi:predicted nucleotidyltransferase
MASEIEDRIRACLPTRREVVAAYLFGSHASGRAHRESDVDVGVLLDRAQ